MLHAGPTLGGLMIVVADRVLVGQLLEQRGVLVLDVVERHRRAAAVVRGRTAIGGDHKGVEIIEAAGRIVFRGVLNAAVGLLPHLIKTMGRIPGVGVVGEAGTGQLKGSVRQVGIVRNARIGCPASDRCAGRAGREQEKVRRFQGWFDRCQQGIAQAREGRRRHARHVRCPAQGDNSNKTAYTLDRTAAQRRARRLTGSPSHG